MQISNINIIKLPNGGNVKAVCSITINNEIVVRNIKIVCPPDGKTFISMPDVKNSKGEYRNIVYPVNKRLREQLSDAILAEYNKKPISEIPFTDM